MTRSYLSLLIIALTVSGCASPSAPATSLVSVSATAAPADLRIGERSNISIDVTNISGRTIQLSAGGCNSEFKIVGANGAVYSQAEDIYCTAILLAPRSLEPGESHRISAFTTGRVTPQGSQQGPNFLPPGTYGIRGVVWVNDRSTVYSSAVSELAMVTFR